MSLEWKNTWRKKYPERARAHMLVMHAMRNGTLQNEDCALCREVKTEAHHEDYTKPIEAIWLCNPCHRELHRKKRSEENKELIILATKLREDGLTYKEIAERLSKSATALYHMVNNIPYYKPSRAKPKNI